MRNLLASLALTFCACGAASGVVAAAQPGDIELDLDPGAQQQLGIATVRLEAAETVATVDAIARVLDVAGLAQLDAEITAARAASAASAAEAERLAALAAADDSASQRELQAALASAAADRTRLELAQQRLALEWSPGETIIDAGRRHELLAAVASGRAALLRADPLESASSAHGAVRLIVDADEPPLVTSTVGPAATVDPRLQASALLVVAEGGMSAQLRPGRVLAAEIDSDSPVEGVMIPRSALVRADGATWAYLRVADDEFLRRQVVEPTMRADGWFVATGFAAGDEVVSQGAGSLLAVERSGESAEDD